MNRLKRGPEPEKNEKTEKTIDCESGVFSVRMENEALKGFKPKQKLQSHSFRDLWLDIVGKLSYRDSVGTLNRLLRRDGDAKISSSTLEERVESFGKSLSAGYMSKAEEILKYYGVQDGIITSQPLIPASVLTPTLPAALEENIVRQYITDYNRGRDSSTKLKFGILTTDIETSTQGNCYISIDDVGVKFQKPSRNDEVKKNRTYVENTVIHIEADGKQYTITAIGMDKAFEVLVAFLLENHLMEDYRLIFFTDGAKCIRDNIKKYFGFRQHTIILDWLHLEKKCYQLMSMAIKGSKAEKDKIKKGLMAILWTGRYDKAIKYLDSVKRTNVKNDKQLEEVKQYIKRKSPDLACYALRSKLGLRISSNRVEKANDIVVASRQKHNGMSWSVAGSGALAVIKVASINGELEGWYRSSTLDFRMVG